VGECEPRQSAHGIEASTPVSLRDHGAHGDQNGRCSGELAHAHARGGRREEALKLVVELLRIETGADHEYVPEFGLIWAYAGLGDNDRAIRWLERACTEGAFRIVSLNVDLFLDPLRSYPRFIDLVRRVGLPTNGPPLSR